MSSQIDLSPQADAWDSHSGINGENPEKKRKEQSKDTKL